jgi:spore maturation protein CgeB
MKIAIFGSSVVSAYWNGAATYYRGMCAALHARGHRIRFVEQDIYERQQHRDFAEDPPYCEVRVVSGWEALERELRAAQRWADLIVKCNDTGAFDREMEEWLVGQTTEMVERRERGDAATPGGHSARSRVASSPRRGWRGGDGPRVVFWDVDAPATLAECAVESCYLRPLIPRFAAIFTYGGGEPVVQRYRALGARRVVPVYNAVDPREYAPVAPLEEYACDLLFIGSRLPDREVRFHQFFLAAAQDAPDCRFLLGGPGWQDLALPPNVRYLGYCPIPLHPVLNCSARLVLNLNRESMAAVGHSPPTRIFEAAACGACLVTDAWEGIETFFTPGEEILVAHGPEDIVRYLRTVTPEEARAIGERARRRTLRQHTYDSRAAVFEAAAREVADGEGG